MKELTLFMANAPRVLVCLVAARVIRRVVPLGTEVGKSEVLDGELGMMAEYCRNVMACHFQVSMAAEGERVRKAFNPQPSYPVGGFPKAGSDREHQWRVPNGGVFEHCTRCGLGATSERRISPCQGGVP